LRITVLIYGFLRAEGLVAGLGEAASLKELVPAVALIA
jgi:hypothetical protein